MSDLDEQLKRGELAERQVQAMLANERSLSLEIERLTALAERLRAGNIKMASEVVGLRADRADLLAEIERLHALLKEARQYVDDAGCDEDSETQRNSEGLLGEIDAALGVESVGRKTGNA